MKADCGFSLTRACHETLRICSAVPRSNAHVGEIGMSAASDTEILDYARANGCIVVTLDADFHTILVVTGVSGPSVIRVRLQGLKGTAVAAIIRDVLAAYEPDLASGCMITVKQHKTTCHLL